MAYTDWPITLPQQATIVGFSDQEQEAIDEFEVDVGEPMTDVRGTLVYNMVTLQTQVMTKAQRLILLGFYRTTLLRVRPFNWIYHPTQDPAVYKFKKGGAPKFEWLTGDQCRATLGLFMLSSDT